MQNAQRTGANSAERTLSASNASQLRTIWVEQTAGGIEGSPIVAGGLVYVSSLDGNESAFYASNGTLKWKTPIGQTTFSACANPTPRGSISSATVVNDTVYVGGGDPYLYALNATTGTREWRVSENVNNPSAGNYNWGSPLVFGSHLYQGLSSACGNPSSQGALIEINLNGSNHSVRHTFNVVARGSTGGAVWSTPGVDPSTNIVWVTTGDEMTATGYSRSIVALNATTLALVGYWQMPTAGGDYDFGAGPTLFADAAGRPLVAALNKNGVVYALNRSNISATGASGPVWRDNVSWYYNSTPGYQACGCALAPSAFDGTHLLVGGGFAQLGNGTKVAGTVRAVDPNNGTPLWIHSSPGVVRAGLATADGLVVDSADANNYGGTTIEVLDAATGSRLWSLVVNRTVNGGPAIADGRIFFGSGNITMKGIGFLVALGIPLRTNLSTTLVPGSWPPQYGFQAVPSGGMPPYSGTWSFADGSPTVNGLTASHTFTRAGHFAVAVTLTDNASEQNVSTVTVTVTDRPVVIHLFLASPTTLTLGGAVDLVSVADGGLGALHYRYGGLPPGCASSDAAPLGCTPNATGKWNVTLTAYDESGTNASASAWVTVNPRVLPPPFQAALSVEPASISLGGSVTLVTQVLAGVAPFTFSYFGLPAGCATTNASSWVCTPSVAGNFTVGVVVYDSFATPARQVVEHAPLAVSAVPPPSLHLQSFSAEPATVVLGQSVGFLVVATEAGLPLGYAYTGLPPGCLPENRSSFQCVPSAAGHFVVRVTVADAVGHNATAQTTLNVSQKTGAGATSPSLLGSSLSAGLLIGGLAVLAGALVGWAIIRSRRSPPSK